MSGSENQEASVLSPEYWMSRWNEATTKERAEMAQRVVNNSLVAASCFARDHVGLESERDWLATALKDQEAAYAALEQQYLGLVDQYGALIDQIAGLAAGADR